MLDGSQAQQELEAGEAARNRGDWKAAVTAYRRYLMMRPGDRAVCNNLAWLLATCPDEKVRSGTQALMLMRWVKWEGMPWQYVGTRAAAHAENGEWEEALAWGGQSQSLADGEDEGRWKRWLALFSQHRPIRLGAKTGKAT